VRDTILAENDRNVLDVRRGRPARTDNAAPSLPQLVAAMQRDSSTYCDEPVDGAAFAVFLSGFSMVGQSGEISRVMRGNAFMTELHSRIVPLVVDDISFWSRYFFRLAQLQAAHGPAAGVVGADANAEPAAEVDAEPEGPSPQSERAEEATEEAIPAATHTRGGSDGSAGSWTVVSRTQADPPAPDEGSSEGASSACEEPAAGAEDVGPPATPVRQLVPEEDLPATTPSPSPMPAGSTPLLGEEEDVDEDWGLS